MKFDKHWVVATAFVVCAGAASAATEVLTLEQGAGPVVSEHGYTFHGLAPSVANLSLSNLSVTALNLASVGLQAQDGARLQASTFTNGVGVEKYVSVKAQADVASVTFGFDDTSVDVRAVNTAGGWLLTTVKNVATNGTGFLSISDLKANLSDKTIYADIVGDNGVGVLNDHALWTFDSVTGASFVPDPADLVLTGGAPLTVPAITLSGLFLANMADIDNLFVKALNLNNTGRSGFSAANTRGLANPDGFGSLTISAVPEPDVSAMVGVGLLGLAWFSRRRASR